jgi:hypothetical protein
MRPTFHHLLELARLSANFELERIPAIGKTPKSTLDPKIERPVRGAPASRLVRGITVLVLLRILVPSGTSART